MSKREDSCHAPLTWNHRSGGIVIDPAWLMTAVTCLMIPVVLHAIHASACLLLNSFFHHDVMAMRGGVHGGEMLTDL